jgi:hypothetical protein
MRKLRDKIYFYLFILINTLKANKKNFLSEHFFRIEIYPYF